MSEDQLNAFLAKIKDDSNLQKTLKAAQSPDEVVRIAKEMGYTLTSDKFSLLSEEELEGVTGGCGTICRDLTKLISLNPE